VAEQEEPRSAARPALERAHDGVAEPAERVEASFDTGPELGQNTAENVATSLTPAGL
jgi:hypothetical protein